MHILDHKFRIVALTESWLQDSDFHLYNLPCYEMFENHRTERTGGGVALYTDIRYFSKHRTDLDIFNNECESLFVEIDRDSTGFSSNVIIGVIYRIPNTNINNFIDAISLTLDRIKKENKICYLLGDFNLDIMNSETHKSTGEYLDMLSSFSYLPMINKPTRVTTDSATIIDNIFTNNAIDLNNCLHGIFITDISDHYPIFHINLNQSE